MGPNVNFFHSSVCVFVSVCHIHVAPTHLPHGCTSLIMTSCFQWFSPTPASIRLHLAPLMLNFLSYKKLPLSPRLKSPACRSFVSLFLLFFPVIFARFRKGDVRKCKDIDSSLPKRDKNGEIRAVFGWLTQRSQRPTLRQTLSTFFPRLPQRPKLKLTNNHNYTFHKFKC